MKQNCCIRVFADIHQINSCRKKTEAMDTGIQQVAAALNLAGNKVRLQILYLLDEEKQLCVCDLSDILKMNVSAISQHLRKLKDGGIVQDKKAGQTIFYSIRDKNMKLLKPILQLINTQKETVQ